MSRADEPAPVRAIHAEKAAYTGGEERPLGSFVALMGTYAAAVGAGALALRASGKQLPERVSAADLALMSVATHKLSRLIAKDPVTSPLRAPFTKFAGTSGEAELAEEVRGSGPRKALGELVTCPFCIGQWAATGFAFGLVVAPRATRMAAAVLTAVTAADVMQLGYAKLEEAAT
ncbi:DUF1360 domain-containing protein [Motilibacter deserti]